MGYVLNDGVTLVKCPVYDESAVYLSRSYSFKRAMYIYMHSNVTWVGREDIVDSAGINLNFPPFYDILLVSTFRIVSCIQRRHTSTICIFCAGVCCLLHSFWCPIGSAASFERAFYSQVVTL